MADPLYMATIVRPMRQRVSVRCEDSETLQCIVSVRGTNTAHTAVCGWWRIGGGGGRGGGSQSGSLTLSGGRTVVEADASFVVEDTL